MDIDRGKGASLPGWVLVGILSLGAFTTALNVTLLSPLLTRIAAEFDVSEAAAGQLATLTAVCSGVAALTVAPWLDRRPRGDWLRLESALLAAGTLLTILAPGFGWLFAGRMLAGLGGAFIFAVSLAAVGDLYPEPVARNRAIGIVGTAATLGAVLGLPVITQLGAAWGWRWAVASLLPLCAILFAGGSWLPRSRTPGHGSLWRSWVRGYADVVESGATLRLLAVIVALAAVWFGWLIYFGAYAETMFAVSAGTLSLLYLSGGAAEVVGNNLTPPMVQRFAPRTVALGSAAVLSADLLAVGVFYTRTWALFPFIVIASVAGVVLFTTTSIMLLDSLPSARGAVMSLQSAGFELGGALGAGAFGAVLAVSGDYPTVYRLLGLVLPVTLVSLALYPGRLPRPVDASR
ncbi:MAG: MFS transporter [Chloroflexia bacterium]|nr:MFS transporter [Chloroflexia bacterium]